MTLDRNARVEELMDVIWRALKEYDHQRRQLRDWRSIKPGVVTVKRGTVRVALARYLAEAIVQADEAQDR